MSVSDVVSAPQLVDVSGRNLSTNSNNIVIIDMTNIENLLPPWLALAAFGFTLSEDKNECLESCYSLG